MHTVIVYEKNLKSKTLTYIFYIEVLAKKKFGFSTK